MANNDPWMTMRESAAYQNCSYMTIRRRIAEGKLKAFRDGNRMIRIRKSDLDAMMRQIPTTEGR